MGPVPAVEETGLGCKNEKVRRDISRLDTSRLKFDVTSKCRQSHTVLRHGEREVGVCYTGLVTRSVG